MEGLKALHIPVPNVQWKTPDDGQTNCPQHVKLLDKNKFGKINASVGFIKMINGAVTPFAIHLLCVRNFVF